MRLLHSRFRFISQIDNHQHFLPSFFVDALRAANVDQTDGFVIPDWTVETRLTRMDALGIEAATLCYCAPGLTAGSRVELAKR